IPMAVFSYTQYGMSTRGRSGDGRPGSGGRHSRPVARALLAAAGWCSLGRQAPPARNACMDLHHPLFQSVVVPLLASLLLVAALRAVGRRHAYSTRIAPHAALAGLTLSAGLVL